MGSCTASAKAVAIAREMNAGRPKDVTARFNLSMSLSRLGAIESDDAAVSLTALQESIALLEPIVKSNPKSGDVAVQLATARKYAAYRLQSLGRMEEAVEQLRESLSGVRAIYFRQQ